ncbi:MAG: hypothetical protein AAGA83_00385 [Cyanobacteria bacterium P01_F01_bin.116]
MNRSAKRALAKGARGLDFRTGSRDAPPPNSSQYGGWDNAMQQYGSRLGPRTQPNYNTAAQYDNQMSAYSPTYQQLKADERHSFNRAQGAAERAFGLQQGAASQARQAEYRQQNKGMKYQGDLQMELARMQDQTQRRQGMLDLITNRETLASQERQSSTGPAGVFKDLVGSLNPNQFNYRYW